MDTEGVPVSECSVAADAPTNDEREKSTGFHGRTECIHVTRHSLRAYPRAKSLEFSALSSPAQTNHFLCPSLPGALPARVRAHQMIP